MFNLFNTVWGDSPATEIDVSQTLIAAIEDHHRLRNVVKGYGAGTVLNELMGILWYEFNHINLHDMSFENQIPRMAEQVVKRFWRHANHFGPDIAGIAEFIREGYVMKISYPESGPDVVPFSDLIRNRLLMHDSVWDEINECDTCHKKVAFSELVGKWAKFPTILFFELTDSHGRYNCKPDLSLFIKNGVFKPSKTDDDTVVCNLRGFMVSDRIVLRHFDSDKWYFVSETGNEDHTCEYPTEESCFYQIES